MFRANEIERSPRGSASSHISLYSLTSLHNLALYPNILSSLLPFKALKDAQIDYMQIDGEPVPISVKFMIKQSKSGATKVQSYNVSGEPLIAIFVVLQYSYKPLTLSTKVITRKLIRIVRTGFNGYLDYQSASKF